MRFIYIFASAFVFYAFSSSALAKEAVKQSATQEKKEPEKKAEKKILDASATPSVSNKDEQTQTIPKPETRALSRENDFVSAQISIIPGIPSINMVAEHTLMLFQKTEKSHPVYGNQKPIDSQTLVVTMIGPDKKIIERYRLLKLSDPGKYGFHFTAKFSGIYELQLTGTLADGTILDITFPYPVDVWPLPAELAEKETSAQNKAISKRAPVSPK